VPVRLIFRIARFIITGSTGFAVEAGVLSLLLWSTSLGPVSSRMISFPIALLVTWMMNRSWSFGDREKPTLVIEFCGYGATQITGFLINFVIYVLLISGKLGVSVLPVLALAIGALTSAVVTFTIFNLGLYREPRHKISA